MRETSVWKPGERKQRKRGGRRCVCVCVYDTQYRTRSCGIIETNRLKSFIE